jgi:hypothetical protein
MSKQNASEAMALLDSVVDTIQASRLENSGALNGLRTDTDPVANSSTEPETFSVTRRKKAPMRALFGVSDSDQSLASPPPPSKDELSIGSDFPAEMPPLIEGSASARKILSPVSPPVNAGSSTEQPDTQQVLAREVQLRVEMADLSRNRISSDTEVQMPPNEGAWRKAIFLDQVRSLRPPAFMQSRCVPHLMHRDSCPFNPQLRPTSEHASKNFVGCLGLSRPSLTVRDRLTILSIHLRAMVVVHWQVGLMVLPRSVRPNFLDPSSL